MWKLARPLSLTRGILMLPPRVGGPAGADGLLAIRRGISVLICFNNLATAVSNSLSSVDNVTLNFASVHAS